MIPTTDTELLNRALSLDTLTRDERSAFSQMQAELAQHEHSTLGQRQRLWVESAIRRAGESAAETSLKTILANLDSIGKRLGAPVTRPVARAQNAQRSADVGSGTTFGRPTTNETVR